MKLATRLNSYFRGKNKDLHTIFQEIRAQGITYVDLNYPEHTKGYSPDAMKTLLAETDLEIHGVALRFREDYINGELGNSNPTLAQQALDLCLGACDYCREIGGTNITIWLGFDGFDYSFQINYVKVWEQLVAAFQKIADYAPDLKISIEYKPFQPRAYAFVDSMGTTGMILDDVQRKNIGVTLDYCHMLMKHENPAMAVDIFSRRQQLYGIHLNDGYGLNDDGLMIGTATPVKMLELLYYLKKNNYKDVIYFDTFPIIEKPGDETTCNVEMIKMFQKAIDEMGVETIQQVIEQNDAIAANQLVMNLFKKM